MPLQKIGSLWRPKKEGSKALASGEIRLLGLKVRVYIFPNRYAKGQNPAEWILMADDREGDQKQQGGGQGFGGPPQSFGNAQVGPPQGGPPQGFGNGSTGGEWGPPPEPPEPWE